MPHMTAAGPATTRYGFLLVPEYSMMAFTAAVDQIRMANRLSGKKLYEWVVISEDGAPVCASNELSVSAVAMRESAGPEGELDAVFVCGGINIETKASKPITAWLREQASRRVLLGRSAPAVLCWRKPGCSRAIAVPFTGKT